MAVFLLGVCAVVATATLFIKRVFVDGRTLFFFQNAVWGVIWLVIAFLFFILGILVGIVAFKVRTRSLASPFACLIMHHDVCVR